MNEKQQSQLLSLVTKFLDSLHQPGINIIVCWATKGGQIKVGFDWPKNLVKGNIPMMGHTSCQQHSPIENVIGRLIESIED